MTKKIFNYIKYKLGMIIPDEEKCELGFHEFGNKDSDFIRREYREVYSEGLDKIRISYYRYCKKCGFKQGEWILTTEHLERVKK